MKCEFRRPCIIPHICEQQLRDAPQVKSNDSTSLKSFSTLLAKTFTTLQKLDELSFVNSLDAISKLVSKLPFNMQSAGFENRLRSRKAVVSLNLATL